MHNTMLQCYEKLMLAISHVASGITHFYLRYNGGEGYVPGSLFHKFDKRQATAYVKGVS